MLADGFLAFLKRMHTQRLVSAPALLRAQLNEWLHGGPSTASPADPDQPAGPSPLTLDLSMVDSDVAGLAASADPAAKRTVLRLPFFHPDVARYAAVMALVCKPDELQEMLDLVSGLVVG